MAAIPPSASINTAHASDELGQIGCKGIGLAGISIDGYRANLAQALARELHEETGLVLTDAHTPWLVWIQTVEFPEMNEQGYAGIANYFFLLHIDTFEPTSGVPVGAAGHPDGEGILDQRWWSITEIESAHSQGVLFSPRALPTLLRAALTNDPRAAPINIGL
ncbi:hypothetical protein [Mycolicibacterium hodleri]|uniref:hypothetical protein n=1 Tax=Mycolicibacterium hodleri TaxID=49897 RepID=UPI0021F2FF0E|nr:hypothetical protein [Mycolicibacterium hodleri]